MSSLLSLFSSTTETRLPNSQVIIPQIPTISLSQSPFALSSPLLYSTPNADAPTTQEVPLTQTILTQEFLERLQKLRNDDVLIADEARPAFLAIQREADELKSELLAARLQLEEKEMEIRELREQLQAQPPPPPDILQPVISKRKRKKMRNLQQRTEAAAAPADETRPPGCDSVQLTPPPQRHPVPHQPPPPSARHQPLLQQQQQQNQQQQQSQTVHYYHDSNSDDKFLSLADIQNTINTINKKQNKPTNKYNINKHATYKLQQTYTKIRHTTYNKNDIVILNVLTNDAPTTKKRPPKTLHQTEHLLNAIYNHLLSQLSPNNIILLESPPLLYEDIFPYASLSFQLARKRGIHFAPTLIGETHIKWYDGVHIQKGYHHLLAKAVASAILRCNPHPFFGHGRPPQGEFGPWLAPRGQGMASPSYSSTATRPPPYHFRQQQRPPTRHIRPLMDINIPRIN